MHRIDRVVDEIEATLRGRGPESDELRAECLAQARDMIAEYENAGPLSASFYYASNATASA